MTLDGGDARIACAVCGAVAEILATRKSIRDSRFRLDAIALRRMEASVGVP
jgi:hypothetical protein